MAAVGAAFVLVVAGCGSSAPSAPLSSPPTTSVGSGASPASSGPGLTWTSAIVEQPSAVTGAPSSAPVHCSPCHNEATLGLAVTTARFGFLLVGLQEPPPRAAVWRSADGMQWARVAGFPAAEGTVAVAAAADDQRAVIVGADLEGAIAWTSTDGLSWAITGASRALAGPLSATRMTTVVAWHGGFVAGGYSDDPAAGRETAAVWTSPDGAAWTRLPDDPAFAGAHILGLTVGPKGLVAVGTAQDEVRGPAVSWTSADGTRWRRSSSQALTAGVMRAVAAGGPGYVAVGLSAADDRAMAWTSADGSAWELAPDSAAFQSYTLPVRMVSIANVDGLLVAVGWKSDAGNGSAVAWVSRDGRAWTRAPDIASFSGAELTGVAVANAVIVGVGTLGYPDNDASAVWISRR